MMSNTEENMEQKRSKTRNCGPPQRLEDYDTGVLTKTKTMSKKRLPKNDELDRIEDKNPDTEEILDVKFCTTESNVCAWHRAMDKYGELLKERGLIQTYIEPDLNSDGKQLKIMSGKYAGSTINIYETGTILIQGRKSAIWADKEYPKMRDMANQVENISGKSDCEEFT